MPKVRALICANCGEGFDSDAPRVKYCQNCRLKHYHPKNPVLVKNCAYTPCGKEFETTRPWAKFCSTPCRGAYHRERYEEMIRSGKTIH